MLAGGFDSAAQEISDLGEIPALFVTEFDNFGGIGRELGGAIFQGFSEGKTYVQSGLVVAIEPEAKFPNSAGAMIRSRVTCTYDLRTRRVVNVAVSEG